MAAAAIGDKIKLTSSSTLGVTPLHGQHVNVFKQCAKHENVGALWCVPSTERRFLEVTFQREAPPG